MKCKKKNTPGRRPANINQGIHVGLSQTSIGASSFTKVMCCMNTPPPSVSGMQKPAYTNMKVIMEENVKDMKLRCRELRSLNILSGKNPASVNDQADGCYNNALYSGAGKTPFQPSTQAICLLQKMRPQNTKLLMYRPNQSSVQNASMYRTLNASMKASALPILTWPAILAMKRSRQDRAFWIWLMLVLKWSTTTDPDSSAYPAAMQLYEDGVTYTEPKHLLDTRHISHNHRKFIKNMSELTKHIPGKFKYERQKMQDKFAIDLAECCQAEFSQAFNKFPHDALKLKSALSYTCDAVIHCYHGNHDLCNLYSFVCLATSNTTWLQRSPFLNEDFSVKPCDESQAVIRKCVEYRLGKDMLEKTKMNTNTQKARASNRSMRRSIPKKCYLFKKCSWSVTQCGTQHQSWSG